MLLTIFIMKHNWRIKKKIRQHNDNRRKHDGCVKHDNHSKVQSVMTSDCNKTKYNTNTMNIVGTEPSCPLDLLHYFNFAV